MHTLSPANYHHTVAYFLLGVYMKDSMAQKKKNGLVAIIKKVSGVLLIILGILGLALPFLQGIAMILAGIYLLQND